MQTGVQADAADAQGAPEPLPHLTSPGTGRPLLELPRASWHACRPICLIHQQDSAFWMRSLQRSLLVSDTSGMRIC